MNGQPIQQDGERNMKLEKKKIIIDADYLIFQCTEGKYIKQNTFANEKVDLVPFKERFDLLVQDIEDEVAVATLGKYKIKGKTKIAFSDPDNNFRYDLQEDYKGNRDSSDRSETYYRLRKWALKKYGYVKNCEADDVVAYYVLHKNYVGCSFDKDLVSGVEGLWFDVHHTRRTFAETSVRDAMNFNMIQNLTGDATDNIRALPKKAGDPMIPCELPEGVARQPFKVTEKLAIALLDEFGWDWDGIVKAYKSKGFGEKEAILTRRLICMRQWSPKKGVKLWKPSKELGYE